MSIPSTEWSDGRLNALERRVDQSATKAEIGDLRRELRERSEGLKRDVQLESSSLRHDVGRVSEKIDEITGDPIQERRARNKAVLGAAVAAMASGLVTLLIYLLLGVHGG